MKGAQELKSHESLLPKIVCKDSAFLSLAFVINKKKLFDIRDALNVSKLIFLDVNVYKKIITMSFDCVCNIDRKSGAFDFYEDASTFYKHFLATHSLLDRNL